MTSMIVAIAYGKYQPGSKRQFHKDFFFFKMVSRLADRESAQSVRLCDYAKPMHGNKLSSKIGINHTNSR